MTWLHFAWTVGVIVFAGTNLSRYGDVIAERTGLGRAWIGVVLLATVTSLPELVTGISSVTFANVPDIAVGNVLGSCMFNMLVIAILDAVSGKIAISTRAHQGQVLSAGFGIVLLAMVGMSLVGGKSVFAFGAIGMFTPIFFLMYLLAMRTVFLQHRARHREIVTEPSEQAASPQMSLRKAYVLAGANGALVVVAALYLPGIGARIAAETGLGQTFVGTFLVAFTTVLPEVVVSLSALRIGAVDMAIGNLFGSTMFNVVILGVDDLVYYRAPLLASVSPNHALAAFTAVGMAAMAIAGLTFRATKKVIVLNWDALGIALIYLFGMIGMLVIE